MARLVVLGAGASFGSENCKESVPPLGDQLFKKLEERSGIASKIPEEMKQLFHRDFESGMAEFVSKYTSHAGAFQRELALYLSSFKPSPESLYYRMLDIFGYNSTFATLNYDLILERAGIEKGLALRYDIEYSSRTISILKPHGSANFWPDVPLGMFKGCLISSSYPGAADVSAPVRPLSPDDAYERCRLDDSLSPAMSMYAKGKHVRSCPEFVSYQQHLFKCACERATTIHVIGVKVVPEDNHIWEPIARSSARLVYFGSAADEVLFNGWRFKSKRRNALFVGAYFDRALAWLKENGLDA
ncbi:hypothetical protein [Pseudomonas putida]